MGQLEKYGLYVLCLVIFLILGVTIWGGGDVPPGRSPAASIRAPSGASVPTPGNAAGSGPARSLAETLLAPVGNDPPRTGAQPVGGGASRQDAGSRDASLTKGATPPGNDPPKADPKTEPKAEAKAEAKHVAYKIQEGDTYGSLARTKLGKESLWTEIQRLNPTIKPEKLRPGTEIRLPTAASLAVAEASRSKPLDKPVAPAPDSNRGYMVKKGDSFARIAQVELGSTKRMSELMDLNPGIPPETLKPGMNLKLPKK